MKNNIIVAVLATILGCMKLPEPPPLTDNEKKYFEKIEKACNCKVKREIEPLIRKEKTKINDEAHYLILLDNIPCNTLENKDSLKKAGKEIAKMLHHQVLSKDFDYFYIDISIGYYCQRTANGYTTQYFDYTLDELDK